LRGVEHATATGAQDIPAQFKQPEPRSVQKAADGLFLVESVLGGEVQDVDAAQFPVSTVADYRLDGGDDIPIG